MLKDKTLDELYKVFRNAHGKETAMWFAKEVYEALHRKDDNDENRQYNACDAAIIHQKIR